MTIESNKSARSNRRQPDAQSAKTKPAKVSHLVQPAKMGLEEWQIALRRQYGQEQIFGLRNTGSQKVFSDFQVTNPTTNGTYRVAIRGEQLGDNFCSCPDFITNTLGTCKHIEFTLQTLRKQPGGEAALKRGFARPYSSIYLRYGAQREVRFRAGTECPEKLRQVAADYFDAAGAMLPGTADDLEKLLAAAAQAEHDLRCYPDAMDFLAQKRDAALRDRVLGNLYKQGADSPAMNQLLRVPLYPYQKEGALFGARAGRCLIGDEMGLGKTIQAIAAAEMMARHFGVRRVLIICPTSLKHQWAREIEKFCQRSAGVIGGLRARREKCFKTDTFYKITNYDTIRRDVDIIERWSPDMVILDEAQRIKNWNTIAARCVKRIQSPYAIVLTGTPLENRLEELVSVVQFVDRHRFGPTFQFLRKHQLHDPETGRVIGYKDLDTIGRTLEPILIRRRKAAVLKDLPERIDKTFFVPMTPQQANHHEENRQTVARIVLKWRQTRYISEVDRQRLLIALQNMRMSCDSTYLLDHESDFGYKADELTTLIDELFEQPDEKVVIFSQWLRMHELLVRRIRDRAWDHVLFHGGVPGNQRGALVDRFREEKKCRAFLATDAGGVGLNLQHSASVVVNVDLPWNPAVLEQRIGRVHRLGQRKPVQVINFVAKDTIEEGMLSLLKFKKSLFSGALDNGESTVMLGGSRLKKFIETVERATSAIPDSPADSAEAPAAAGTDSEDAHHPQPVMPGGVAASESVDGTAPSQIISGDTFAESKATNTTGANPWAGLLQVGLGLLEQIAAQTGRPPTESDRPTAQRTGSIVIPSLIHRDERTGEPYMKIPVPNPELLERALKAISSLLER